MDHADQNRAQEQDARADNADQYQLSPTVVHKTLMIEKQTVNSSTLLSMTIQAIRFDSVGFGMMGTVVLALRTSVAKAAVVGLPDPWDSADITVVVPTYATRRSLKVVEIPIYFADPAEGSSKVNLRVQFETAKVPFELLRSQWAGRRHGAGKPADGLSAP